MADIIAPQPVEDDFIALGDNFSEPTSPPSRSTPPSSRSLPWPTAPPPWVRGRDYTTAGEVATFLHREIKDFVSYVSPTPEQARSRARAVARVQTCVHGLWPEATVCVFGSYATSLYLPLSDIDIVIVSEDGRHADRASLFRLANALKAQQVAASGSVEVVARARVPIVKYVDRVSGIAIDVSFERYGGVLAADTVLHWVANTPGLRELVLVVKTLLAQRELSNVANGGLGGYAAVCLVRSFLQMHPAVQSGRIRADENLGVLLLQFFDLYGRHFSYDDVGLSLTRGGKYFSRRPQKRGRDSGSGNGAPPVNYSGGGALYIEDPNDPTNNISRGTYNLRNVRRAFAGAHEILAQQCYELDAVSRREWRARTVLGALLRAPAGVEESEEEDDVKEICRPASRASSKGSAKAKSIASSGGGEA
ncbi:uncharacterized protein V1518DRAFT_80156 [Limtongia smithiae]|uniref:uncharacterized protein n=1 Tax=Limtongia smithiae TaxID=1125753 RepID=UPI0034CD823A